MISYSLILDLIIVIAGLMIIVSAYRNGFLRSIILVVGYVASIFIASTFSKKIAEFLYDNMIAQRIAQDVDKLIADATGAASVSSITSSMIDKLPTIISNPMISKYGSESALINSLEEKTGGVLDNFSKVISQSIVKPIVNSVLQVILCLLIFTVCVILVKMIAKVFKSFYAVPVLGTINSLLGGVLGVVQALVMLYFAALVSSIIIALSGNQLSFFNTAIIDSTYLFKKLYYFKLI